MINFLKLSFKGTAVENICEKYEGKLRIFSRNLENKGECLTNTYINFSKIIISNKSKEDFKKTFWNVLEKFKANMDPRTIGTVEEDAAYRLQRLDQNVYRTGID